MISCGGTKEGLNAPPGIETYPTISYRAVKVMAQRTGPKDITRMVGWDEEFYYFDWYQEELAISRGTGRSERSQFDAENKGALTLEKGNITVKDGQVRTLKFE